MDLSAFFLVVLVSEVNLSLSTNPTKETIENSLDEDALFTAKNTTRDGKTGLFELYLNPQDPISRVASRVWNHFFSPEKGKLKFPFQKPNRVTSTARPIPPQEILLTRRTTTAAPAYSPNWSQVNGTELLNNNTQNQIIQLVQTTTLPLQSSTLPSTITTSTSSKPSSRPINSTPPVQIKPIHSFPTHGSGHGVPIQPGQGVPTQPGQGVPTQPGQGVPTQPGQGVPTQPGQGVPTQPGQGVPQPGQGFPPQPGQGIPQQPGQGFPQQPGQGFPQQPGQGLPNQPGQGFPPQQGGNGRPPFTPGNPGGQAPGQGQFPNFNPPGQFPGAGQFPQGQGPPPNPPSQTLVGLRKSHIHLPISSEDFLQTPAERGEYILRLSPSTAAALLHELHRLNQPVRRVTPENSPGQVDTLEGGLLEDQNQLFQQLSPIRTLARSNITYLTEPEIHLTNVIQGSFPETNISNTLTYKIPSNFSLASNMSSLASVATLISNFEDEQQQSQNQSSTIKLEGVWLHTNLDTDGTSSVHVQPELELSYSTTNSTHHAGEISHEKISPHILGDENGDDDISSSEEDEEMNSIEEEILNVPHKGSVTIIPKKS